MLFTVPSYVILPRAGPPHRAGPISETIWPRMCQIRLDKICRNLIKISSNYIYKGRYVFDEALRFLTTSTLNIPFTPNPTPDISFFICLDEKIFTDRTLTIFDSVWNESTDFRLVFDSSFNAERERQESST